jgi:TetR/AcrR family transcriptional regulator, tetracycline repressor protein
VTSVKRSTLAASTVVEAAIALADRDGLEELSMRRLAAELGIGAMTLYGHFRNKDELLTAMADAVLVDVGPPPTPGDDWLETAREVALRLRAALLAHPGVAPLVARCGSSGPNAFAATEASLAWLHAVGFDEDETPRVFQAILTFVLGAVALEAPYLRTPGGVAEKADEMRLVYESLPASQYPRTVAMADHLFILDSDAQFAYGLDLLLAGLEQRHRKSLARGPRRTQTSTA